MSRIIHIPGTKAKVHVSDRTGPSGEKILHIDKIVNPEEPRSNHWTKAAENSILPNTEGE